MRISRRVLLGRIATAFALPLVPALAASEPVRTPGGYRRWYRAKKPPEPKTVTLRWIATDFDLPRICELYLTREGPWLLTDVSWERKFRSASGPESIPGKFWQPVYEVEITLEKIPETRYGLYREEPLVASLRRVGYDGACLRLLEAGATLACSY